MNQGDIYWHTFKAPDKRRPVVILTRNDAIPYLQSITIAAVTTTIRAIDSAVLLSVADGLMEECAISLDNINTIPKSQLGSYITHLPRERMREVRDAVNFAFGFDALN